MKNKLVLLKNEKKEQYIPLLKVTIKDEEYLIYTDNTKCDDGTKNIYASSYIYNENSRILENITTEEEWKMIEAILSYLTKEN